ncbi:hypothetical protein FRB98_006922 [Tulasnella sp. 332]|nr:hypothetical protein FRB98_006922 [Tulasnella sp. 332]
MSMIDQCPAHCITTILKRLLDREILLNEFELRAWFEVSSINRLLASHLSSQTRLKRIGLPYYYGTPAVVSALGGLPELEVVYPTNLQTERESGRRWELVDGTFTELSSFGFNASLLKATEIFRQRTVSHLRHIHLITPQSDPASAGLMPFLLALISACPQLRALSLNLYQNPATFQAIDFSSLQPLLQCRGIETLEIADRKPMIITEVDVREMATAWPSLRRLDLTPEPIDSVAATVGNPLSLLNQFAASFHTSLETIGLFFRVDRKDLIDHRGFDISSGLRTLVVGSSRITQAHIIPVSAFLGGMCNPGLALKAGRRSWCRAVMDRPTMDGELSNVELWKKAAEAMQEFHAFLRPRLYRMEDVESKIVRAGRDHSWRQITSKSGSGSSHDVAIMESEIEILE